MSQLQPSRNKSACTLLPQLRQGCQREDPRQAVQRSITCQSADGQKQVLRRLRRAAHQIDDQGVDNHGPDPRLKRYSWEEPLRSDEVSVSLSAIRITDAGLVHLSGLSSLERLKLDNTKISDVGLGNLKALSSLKLLHLFRTRITDAGLQHLKGLINLEDLNLFNTRITDAGLEHLKGLKNLEYLALYGTNVTDVGLELLTNLTRLESLWLGDTTITKAGVTKLRQALPNVRIY